LGVVERERVARGFDARVLVDFAAVERVARGFAAADRVPVVFEARVLVDFAAVERVARGFAAADRVLVDFAAVEREVLGFAAVEREVLGFAAAVVVVVVPLRSSDATRRASASMSARRPLTSSSTFRSSIVSRIRTAAAPTSSTSLRVRSWVPAAPSEVAWNVRSTALRTASTASAAPEPCLSFFFLSFLGMVSTLIKALAGACGGE